MRFSLVSLLAFTGIIAILCDVFFALPDAVSVFVLAVITVSVIPAASISGIVFGRGKARAFSIGALGSMAWMGPLMVMMTMLGGMIGTSVDDEGYSVWKMIFAGIYTTCLLCGLIGMGVRWLCLPKAEPNTPQSTMLLDPRDKAELYAILQGRMAGGVETTAGSSIA